MQIRLKAMISLANLLVKKTGCTTEHLRVMLDGMSDTAFDTRGCSRASLQEELRAVTATVDCSAAPEQVSYQLARAIHVLDAHNRAAEAAVNAQQSELRNMIAIASDTIAAIGASSKDGVDHLRKLESTLEGAGSAEDLKLVRNRLFACLTLVRNETLRMQLESQKLTRSLKSAVLKASSQLLPGTDKTTGLPGPESLGQSIHELLGQGHIFSAGIFVLTDLQRWNARLGRQCGDEILQSASEFLQGAFAIAGASTYRWNGPAFLITCRGDETALEEFEAKVRQLARKGFDIALAIEGELKTLSLPFSWIVQRFDRATDAEQVMRLLDEITSKL